MPISYLNKPPQMSAAQAQYFAMVQQANNQTATAGGLASLFTVTATTSTGTGTTWTTASAPWVTDHVHSYDDGSNIVIPDGVERNIHLPDGSFIVVAKDGSFTINDKDAKVTYRANRTRDFNPFINASDKLEGFIKFCGELGVKQAEMLALPIQYFIEWLILEAARADGEEAAYAPLVQNLIPMTQRRRCRCGRFLARRHIERQIAFCRPVCLEKELAA